MQDSNCLFCKIIKGEIPSIKVYENDDVFSFLDIHPVNPGHTLVIPKNHFANIHDTPEEKFGTLMIGAKKIATAVKEGLRADGINIGMNNEPAAGQLVFHAHIHVIPRFASDGFQHWKGRKNYKDGEAEETAQKIQNILAEKK